MEKKGCSFRQAIAPGQEVIACEGTIHNKTKKVCHICTALLQIVSPESPFYKYINVKQCGLLDATEETCPVSKKGFSLNQTTIGIALNEYMFLLTKQTDLQSKS